MTKLAIFSLFLTFFLYTQPDFAHASSLCQSNTLCVHSNMNLYSQGSYSFIQYLQSQGVNVSQDQGYCVPFASAMFLGVLKADSNNVYKGNALDLPIDAQVYSLGNAMGTNWYAGGTYVSSAVNVVYDLTLQYPGWSPFQPEKYLISPYTYPPTYGTYAYPSINGFKAAMPTVGLNVRGATTTSPHFLALNGIEGQYHKIFDPWGRIYNVDGTTTVNVLKNPSGYGYVSYYGNSATVSASVGSTRPSIDRSPNTVAGCTTNSGTGYCWGGAKSITPNFNICTGYNSCPVGSYMTGTLSCSQTYYQAPATLSGGFSCKVQ